MRRQQQNDVLRARWRTLFLLAMEQFDILSLFSHGWPTMGQNKRSKSAYSYSLLSCKRELLLTDSTASQCCQFRPEPGFRSQVAIEYVRVCRASPCIGDGESGLWAMRPRDHIVASCMLTPLLLIRIRLRSCKTPLPKKVDWLAVQATRCFNRCKLEFAALQRSIRQ